MKLNALPQSGGSTHSFKTGLGEPKRLTGNRTVMASERAHRTANAGTILKRDLYHREANSQNLWRNVSFRLWRRWLLSSRARFCRSRWERVVALLCKDLQTGTMDANFKSA